MPLFSRRIPYDRKRLLKEADHLVEGRRWRGALRRYRQILAAEPHNPQLHAKIAPLLARSGRRFEAWESFRIAAEGLDREGSTAMRLTLHQQAVNALPRCFEAWRALARAELQNQKPDRARRALVEGSRRLRGRGTRGEAIALLRDAREIDPWNPAVVLELGRLLARDGQAGEALFLLDHLDQQVSGEDLIAVRGLTLRIEPSLRHVWRWLAARIAARENDSIGAARSSA